ncbi:MAG: membrane dipeptidase [Bryobacterales bacterium]
MTRRTLLRRALGGVAVGPTIIRGWCATNGAEPVLTRAVTLVEESPVVDMMGLLTTDWARLERWRSKLDGLGEHDRQTILSSGVSMFHPAVRLPGPDAARKTRSWLDRWRGFASFHPGVFRIVESLQDWRAVRCGDEVGILLGSQDSEHFRSAADVEMFAALGQKVSQLTYNGRNALGGGCGLRHDPGLSSLGVEIVGAMNRVGMIVDVSHCGPQTTLDAIEASKRTVLVTHSNCAALAPGAARCKSDEAIRKLAARGGVIGITAIAKFVTASYPARFEHVLDHFDHVARLTGTEHVGLGSDGGVLGLQRNLVPGFGRPDSIFRLTEGLIRRGYSDADIRRMLGFNFERVLREHLYS